MKEEEKEEKINSMLQSISSHLDKDGSDVTDTLNAAPAAEKPKNRMCSF